jgi:cytochrome c
MSKTGFLTIAATAFAAAALAPAQAAPAPAAAVPAGDAVHGAVVFNQCKVCHVADKGVNRIGPSLWAVVGRKSGSIAGYTYSAANKNSGITWTADKLFVYLEAPQKLVPGTKMAFAGLKNPKDRADVIAFLKTKA